MLLAGLDGCPKGWVGAVAQAHAFGQAKLHFIKTGELQSFMAAERIGLAVVDIPIGFTAGPSNRDVEGAMRAFLVGKGASVFNTPARAALVGRSHSEASELNRQHLTAVARAGLSIQSFGIFPKMREMDEIVQAVGQNSIREGHPEVSFAVMNGTAVLESKASLEGRLKRIALLEAQGIPAATLSDAPRLLRAKRDDVLDALALLWSANRFADRKHITFPPVPSRDAVGLEMSVIA